MRRHLQRIYDAEGLGSVPGLKPLPIPLQLSLTWRLGEAGDKDWAVLLSDQSAALARDTNAAELVASLAEETGRRVLTKEWREKAVMRALGLVMLRRC